MTAEPTLREIVLCLLTPGEPIPIRATSDVHYREQEATRGFASKVTGDISADLDRSPDALRLLERFCAPADLLDEVATLFLDKAARLGPTFGFDYLAYATRVALLGATHPVLERALAGNIASDFLAQAEALAIKLDRRLYASEVLELVRVYTTGGSSSDASDRSHIEIAGRHLDEPGMDRVKQLFADRNRRWRGDLY